MEKPMEKPGFPPSQVATNSPGGDICRNAFNAAVGPAVPQILSLLPAMARTWKNPRKGAGGAR